MAKKSCHVFLSFKGETRNAFTCFLHEALEAQGFNAFMDEEDISIGDELDSRIRKGIKDSMSAIVVLSKSFASSKWCLNELLQILERRNTSTYFIIPIFYEVKPADVKHHPGVYSKALEDHEERHGEDKVKEWRDALKEVGNIRGVLATGGEQRSSIPSIVNLFRQKFSEEFPEYRLPSRKILAFGGNTTSTCSQSEQPECINELVLYTTEPNYFPDTTAWLKTMLKEGNVTIVERNCFKNPKYMKELQKLVRDVKFPTLIMNGKDLCEVDEVEGLESCQLKPIQNYVRYLRISTNTRDNFVKSMMNVRGTSWFKIYGANRRWR